MKKALAITLFLAVTLTLFMGAALPFTSDTAWYNGEWSRNLGERFRLPKNAKQVYSIEDIGWHPQQEGKCFLATAMFH